MSPQIDVSLLPGELSNIDLSGRSVVVVDLLRASTVIVHAMKNGARGIVPAASRGQAADIQAQMGRENTLMCGERMGLKIEGFDLGNSPLEYTPEVVAGKTLIFASSNGSAAFLATKTAARMAVGALVNARAVVDWVCESNSDCSIVCAGKLGQYSEEDTAAAGELVANLVDRGFEAGNDGARSAVLIAEHARNNWDSFLSQTDHGKYLSSLGFEADLKIAAKLDSETAVPEWADNRFALSGAIERIP